MYKFHNIKKNIDEKQPMLSCDKSKLYFELGVTVTRREIQMDKSTDMGPKSTVEDLSPYLPLDTPLDTILNTLICSYEYKVSKL